MRVTGLTNLGEDIFLVPWGENPAPILKRVIADRSVNEDTAFVFTLANDTFEDSDTDEGDVMTLTATLSDGSALPAWLTFDAQARSFSGTPPLGATGTISVRVTATDTFNISASDEFQITVAPQYNRINGTASGNRIDGTKGADWIQGLAGNDRLEGRDGNDVVDGGTGSDQLSGGSGNDRLIGGDGNDTLAGDAGNDQLFGGSGNDSLRGGNGADRLDGGAGVDSLGGGAGADRFVFSLASDSASGRRDTIIDFNAAEDMIDLSGIDADTTQAGDQMFLLIGSATFSNQAGELRYANGIFVWRHKWRRHCRFRSPGSGKPRLGYGRLMAVMAFVRSVLRDRETPLPRITYCGGNSEG